VLILFVKHKQVVDRKQFSEILNAREHKHV